METKITICACASRKFIDKKQVAKLATALAKQGFEVNIEEDLCRLVEQKSKRLAEIAESTIIACHERAVRNLLKFRELETESLFDLRQQDSAEILKAIGVDVVLTDVVDEGIEDKIAAMEPEPGEDAWFPVIDTERCINCRKCHDFCLFGVYTIENKQVKVLHPENCKNNCPACARTSTGRRAVYYGRIDALLREGRFSSRSMFRTQVLTILQHQ